MFLLARTCMHTVIDSNKRLIWICVCVWLIQRGGVWVISSAGLIWYRLHYTHPRSLRESPQSFLRRFSRLPRAELKHSAPSPRLGPLATYITYWTPHNNEGRRGACVCVLFPFEEVSRCSPKEDPGPRGPSVPQTPLLKGVCLCTDNAYMSM